METKKNKSLILVIAAVFIIASCVLPLPEGLTHAGMQSFGVILAAIVLWVSEALNMAVTGIFMSTLLVFMKVLSPGEMFKGFGGSVFFFMVGTMSITTAMASTTIPTRIAGTIMTWAKKSPRKLVVGFAVGTALLSSIMSNIPTCALFASLGLAVLKANGDPKPGTSNLGKCLMIAIPAGSVVGGYMTPAGSPTNIMAVATLTQIGRPVSFLNTTCVALMGTCLFMFPGIDVMTWDEYSQKGGWDAPFMVGSVGAIADAALNTGAAKWLIITTLGSAAEWNPMAIFILISFLVCIIHILIPSGPAVAGLAVVPIVELALLAGINPVGAALLVSFWSAVTFVLPTDAVPMFTYKFGYYGFGDMMRAGIPISIVVALLVAVLIPGACTLLGC